MYFTRKSMSEASKTIFKEQRELTKERILGNPALVIGTIGFLVILTAAVFVAYQFCRSECNVGIRAFQSARRSVFIWNR